MNVKEIRESLESRRDNYNTVGETEALTTPIDKNMFYSLIGKIAKIEPKENSVRVTFSTPSQLSHFNGTYRYTVEVSDTEENFHGELTRDGMPRLELLTMQQIAIVIWSMYTGRIY